MPVMVAQAAMAAGQEGDREAQGVTEARQVAAGAPAAVGAAAVAQEGPLVCHWEGSRQERHHQYLRQRARQQQQRLCCLTQKPGQLQLLSQPLASPSLLKLRDDAAATMLKDCASTGCCA